jgi:hypothetical protein
MRMKNRFLWWVGAAALSRSPAYIFLSRAFSVCNSFITSSRPKFDWLLAF